MSLEDMLQDDNSGPLCGICQGINDQVNSIEELKYLI